MRPRQTIAYRYANIHKALPYPHDICADSPKLPIFVHGHIRNIVEINVILIINDRH